MMDFAIVAASAVAYALGRGDSVIRVCIVCHLAISSLFASFCVAIGFINHMDPWFYYVQLVLALLFFYLIILPCTAESKRAALPFVVIAVVSLLVFLEYYSGTNLFYEVYPVIMVTVTCWQLYQLVRIGDVGGNVKRWARGLDFSGFWGNCYRAVNSYIGGSERPSRVDR